MSAVGTYNTLRELLEELLATDESRDSLDFES